MKKIIIISSCIFLNSITFFAKAQIINSEKKEDSDIGKSVLCGGIERWDEKVLVDAYVNTVNFTPVNISILDLISLTTPFPNANMLRYPGVEDKTYTVTCKITIKKDESDNDIHLVLSDGTHTLIGEVPDPACSIAAGSAHVNQYIAARNFVNAHIATGNVYNVNIPSVTITGVAFLDPPHGQTGAAPNYMELHPILDIHFTSENGINEENKKILDVTIGSNPFNTSTTIKVISQINNLKECTLKLFNTLGEEVKEMKLPVLNNRQIDYTLQKGNLNPGIYMYRITNSGASIYEGKFLID